MWISRDSKAFPLFSLAFVATIYVIKKSVKRVEPCCVSDAVQLIVLFNFSHTIYVSVTWTVRAVDNRTHSDSKHFQCSFPSITLTLLLKLNLYHCVYRGWQACHAIISKLKPNVMNEIGENGKS